jgi:fibronectin-binding autotransporter adhesin
VNPNGTQGTLFGNIAVTGSVTFDQSFDVIFTNTFITGAGSVIQSGPGKLTLSNADTYSGGTTVSAGTLGVGNDLALGTGTLAMSTGTTLQAAFPTLVGFSNTVTLAGSVTFDTGSEGLALSGVISGTGSLTKISSGTLELGGINTYSGGTTVSNGTLALISTGSVSTSSGVNLFSSLSTFDITGTSSGTTITTLQGVSGTVNLGSKTLTISNGSTTFAGTVQGPAA